MRSRNGILYRERKTEPSRAEILLVHGLGGHSERWNFLSEFFLRNNFSSYAVELKGFGETEGLKGHVDSLDTYLDDILTLRNIIASENPGRKIFLLGESMGGLIAFLTAGRDGRPFNGIICISPAFKNKIRFSAIEYIEIFLNFVFNPKRQFRLNFDSLMCTRDNECRKVMDSDPREHRLATARLLVDLARAQMKARKLKNKIETPILFLLAGEDKMVDSAATERLFGALRSDDKTMLIYAGMYHALSIDTGREKVFGDILKWMEERT